MVRGPLSKEMCDRLASDELQLDYADGMPRIPAPEAIEAAQLGLRLFEEASESEQIELPGTLTWLLFSPLTREGEVNPIHAETQAFAAAECNPHTCAPYPYRCWHELAQVLVAGGAKYAPSTSAQLESMFTGLTRQQGASKHHISQIQISFEARGVKNETMGSLTESSLRSGWPDAKRVKESLAEKGFWRCDLTLAANRKLSQKLKEVIEFREGDDIGMTGLACRGSDDLQGEQ